jgi:cytochrome c oxidase assembly factor CtaG
MTAHMLEHMALTLVLAPAVAAGMRVRLRVAPALALAQFGLVVVVLHVPAVWDAVHVDAGLRVLADVATLASAVAFWWPALAEGSPLGAIARTGYLMIGMPVMSAVGVALSIVHRPLYAGVSLEEQHRAGAMMWGVGSAVSALILVAAVWAHLLREERRAVEAAGS